jgi:hypothetical protein
MPADLTLLYYSCNVIPEGFATRVRAHLLSIKDPAWPIVSVTHEPIDFGRNIVVGQTLGRSVWAIYQQIAIGAAVIETPYVACVEDDSLYTPAHFETRPNPGEFTYNISRLWLEQDTFRYRRRTGMFTCITETQALRDDLARRHAKYPTCVWHKKDRDTVPAPAWFKYYGEPGRCNTLLKLPPVPWSYVETPDAPPVTVNHFTSLGGKRRTEMGDTLFVDHPYWGSAPDLWRQVHG